MAEFTFTPAQQRAIDDKSDLVITACPGSGKTSVVAKKIGLLALGLQNHEGVIGITFTVKASNELRSRCRIDGINLKSSFFGTIDDFCLSVIIYPYISRIFGKPPPTLECKLKIDLSEELAAEIVGLSDVPTYCKSEDYSHHEAVFRQLYKKGVVLLESVPILALEILSRSKACQKQICAKFPSVFVDEYQDSSEPQHKIFLKLHELGLHCVAVGDKDQSIYAWRGSSPKYMQDLIDRCDAFNHHQFHDNFRCHPSIKNYANRILDETCSLEETNEVRVKQFYLNGDQSNVAKRLDKWLEAIHTKRLVSSLSEVAVLVRKNDSLKYLKAGINVPSRIYQEDRLSSTSTLSARLMQRLLFYRFDKEIQIKDVLRSVNDYYTSEEKKKHTYLEVLSNIRKCSRNDDLQAEIVRFVDLAFSGVEINCEAEALESVLDDENFLKLYKPINQEEVQVMTLHKAKGLEFEVVFHLDLYDWIFPKRIHTGDFDEVKYKDWKQDLNLHYVGITRAKRSCFLISSNSRFNYKGDPVFGRKSQFMHLTGIAGLYS